MFSSLLSKCFGHPHFTLLQVFTDSIATALVAFAIGQGLGKMFALKHGLRVFPNQELRAQVCKDVCSESGAQVLPKPGAQSPDI